VIYELYCCGHVKKFKTRDGYIRRCVRFCGGCRKRQIRKLLKNNEASKASELCGDAFICESALVFVATAIICI
jgi:hypothetical protein